MKNKTILSAILLLTLSLSIASCSKNDDNPEPEQTEQTKEVRKNMSVEVSYSGDFSSGSFIFIINGFITKADSSSYVAPLVDERDGKPYTLIQLQSKGNATTAQTLKFHSKDKVAGIMVAGSVTDDDDIDGITNIEVRVKVYSNDKLIDDRTITYADNTNMEEYAVLATGE